MCDTQCPKCRRRYGWRGEPVACPPCPRCGHRPDPEALAGDQAQLDWARRELTRTGPESDSGRTVVVSVRDALPDTYLYVGRRSVWPGCTFEASPFANPFRVRRGAAEAERRECLAKYRTNLLGRPDLLARLPELRGKRLGCWCGNWRPGDPELLCHAVLLAKMADGEEV